MGVCGQPGAGGWPQDEAAAPALRYTGTPPDSVRKETVDGKGGYSNPDDCSSFIVCGSVCGVVFAFRPCLLFARSARPILLLKDHWRQSSGHLSNLKMQRTMESSGQLP